MIKVTEEMQLAFIEAKQASTWGPNTAYVDGIAAVLAIVERDCDVRERTAVPAVCGAVHPAAPYDCERPPGHSAQHLSWRAGPVIVW